MAWMLKGEMGARSGMLCTFMAAMLTSSRQAPSITPYSPREPPSTIKAKRRMAIGPYRVGSTKEHSAVSATTITMGAPISPARTAVPQ